MPDVGKEWGALREFSDNVECLDFEVEPEFLCWPYFCYEIFYNVSSHKGAAIILRQKQPYKCSCHLKMRHYHIYISLGSSLVSNPLFFYVPKHKIYVYQSYYLPIETIISCTHKQRRSVLFSSIFSYFQLIFPNCTLMISHLTLSNMKRIIQLLACSDLGRFHFYTF